MEKKKTKKWWLLGAAALVVAVAVGVTCLVLGAQKRPRLYWNLDGYLYNANINPRTPGEDGTWQVRFALEDEVVTLTVKEQELINKIDKMRALSLTVDKEGVITDAQPAETVATRICDGSFIKSMEEKVIHVNGSLAMNGMDAQINLSKHTRVYDISDGNVTVGQVSDLLPMDGVSAFANEKGQVTHLFVTSHPEESSIYWRVERMYNTSKKVTSREPDENGVYSVEFYADGQVVTLQAKDVELVTAIDAESASNPHFGFTFDEEGYISGILKSALGIRGLLACESYDITEMTEDTVTATELLNNKGLTWTGSLLENCAIYDISGVAQAENRKGQQVEGLQLGDRVTVWTDTEGRATQIYVTTRLVDSPAFFSISRKFDSKTGETTRKPNEEGWYEVTLLKEGETETAVYKTKDKALMSYLDSYAGRCFGIRADENNVLQTVYHGNCLYGASAWSNGSVVANTVGSVITKMVYGKATTTGNAVMMPDCKVYNVSTTGAYGEETKIQTGDYFYAFAQPSGELVQIYVVRRCLGADTMYYNLGRRYDDKTKQTTRQPDEAGWYYFEMAHNGEKVTLKTDDQALATKIDANDPGAVSLLVEEDVILEVNAPTYACGGSQVANGYTFSGMDAKGRLVAVDGSGKETTIALAADCVIYDTRSGGKQVDSIREGDTITVYTERTGTARIIYTY